jgi:type II secretory pathway pseudopilin PulG
MKVTVAVAIIVSVLAGAALAKLPPLSPEQEQAAAAKKQAEEAQLAKQKQALERVENRVAEYYKRTKGKSGSVGAHSRVEDTNMSKTTHELARDAGPQGGREPSAEAHSAPAK